MESGENTVKLAEILLNKKSNLSPKKNPTFRIHKIQNNKIAIDFLSVKFHLMLKKELKNKGGFDLTNVSTEDIVNGNKKIILGFIWRLILRFQISKVVECKIFK
jgi:hypothetical protein